MKVYNIKDKMEYLPEVITLTHNQWSKKKLDAKEMNEYIQNKIIEIQDEIKEYCKLILIDNNTLIGFISLFKTDGKERQELNPWYATMYVKEEYRGRGYSKILNDEILKEAKNRGFNKIYLKTNLKNYYEKYGAKYIEDLKNGECLYYIDIEKR